MFPTRRYCQFNARRDVRGFYFQSRRLLPTLVLVPTVFRSRKAQDCHPVFEAILRVQPRAGVPLHQIVIFITDIGRKRHRYLIAFRYDPTMGRNRSLEALCEPVVWRGELVVLKGGKRDDVINITTLADRNIAQVAVRL